MASYPTIGFTPIKLNFCLLVFIFFSFVFWCSFKTLMFPYLFQFLVFLLENLTLEFLLPTMVCSIFFKFFHTIVLLQIATINVWFFSRWKILKVFSVNFFFFDYCCYWWFCMYIFLLFLPPPWYSLHCPKFLNNWNFLLLLLLNILFQKYLAQFTVDTNLNDLICFFSFWNQVGIHWGWRKNN